MVNVTKHNAPALRFDGFDDEWEVKEFGSVVTRSSTISAEPTLPRLEYEDIVSGIGVLNKDLSRKESLKAGLLFGPGDVLYGKLRPYLKNWLLADFHGIAVGDFWVLQSFTADPKFLYQLIQTSTYGAVTSISSGSKMPRADWKLVSQSRMTFPSTSEEQRAIGELFADLDALIEQHRAKHENLQQTKTALMQRMFPRDGADEPELRLGGFSGAWEAKPLKNLGSSYGGLTGKTKEDFGHGDARYITYLDVFERALITDTSRLGATDIDNRQSEVKTGDVLFTVSSEVPEEVGMSAVWLGQRRNIYLNSFCFGFRPTAELDSKFLAYVLRSSDFRKKMTLLAQGISRFNISKTRAMELEISFPTLEEQRAIGEVFTNLDALITAESRYITQLTQAKTALLQRMFV